jgi:3-deoxy-D-manno-octulosonic-acid transferase
MYFIYSLLLGLGVVILLPKFLFDAFRHGKYVAGIRERLGFLTPLENKRPVVWLHCVSVGEAQAARPLVDALRREFPNYAIAISTVTVTGQQLAREIFSESVQRVFYFPFDWRWCVRRAMRAIKPAVALILETELWPNFLRECRAQEIPAAVVNGRLSEKSYRRYSLIRPFVLRVVDCLDLAVMQTEADAGRIRALGLGPERVVVSGSMKFDGGTINEVSSVAEELATRFDLEKCPLILAASTHESEEKIILEAFRELRKKREAQTVRLLIAPRHPERFGEVASLLQASELRWTRRSAPPRPDDIESEVVLLDSIGELRSLFPLASIVFVGGSIARAGGHNILEPAAAGACIITGPHTENFREIVRTFVEADALIQLEALPDQGYSSVLANLFDQLLLDPNRRNDLGARAQALVNVNQGATKRTLQCLNEILTRAGETRESELELIAEEGVQSTWARSRQ